VCLDRDQKSYRENIRYLLHLQTDSELKKYIQEKLPENYSSVFTLRNLLTDKEKIIRKKILPDEAIIFRDCNLEVVTLDGKSLEEPILKPPEICFQTNNRTSKKHSYRDFKAKQLRLEGFIQRLYFRLNQ
jgi:hypothetical protein